MPYQYVTTPLMGIAYYPVMILDQYIQMRAPELDTALDCMFMDPWRCQNEDDAEFKSLYTIAKEFLIDMMDSEEEDEEHSCSLEQDGEDGSSEEQCSLKQDNSFKLDDSASEKEELS